jgi:hypothetical protein
MAGDAIMGESMHMLPSATAPGVRGVRAPALALMLPVEAPLPLQNNHATKFKRNAMVLSFDDGQTCS